MDNARKQSRRAQRKTQLEARREPTTIRDRDLFITNLSSDQKFAILVLKDAVHGGRLVVPCTKYSVAQAPTATEGIQDAFVFHIVPVKNER